MNKFITVSNGSQTYAINVSHIIRIDENAKSCIIRMSSQGGDSVLSIEVRKTLEELLEMIK